MSLKFMMTVALGAAALIHVPQRASAQDRMGSGTSWTPDAVSLPAVHFMPAGWDLMLQGIAFGQYDAQSGPRGGDQWGSLNWGMLMAEHSLGGGELQLHTMLSLDALGVSARGYPLLLQSGESYQGAPIHDRQHPHDFLMELGALYERPLSGALHWLLYAAPIGEPALGPVAFPMRPSAMDNPLAPLGHHWQDATHISFGVITAGVFTHDWKLEGSLFNGREPDDNRWNIDPIKLDSYSGRLTYNANANWSVAAGYGYLASPDALTPTLSEHRLTASVMHATTLGADGQWATTWVWGANATSGQAGLSHSGLMESEAVLDARNTIFGRVEYVQKSAADLVVDTPSVGLPPNQIFGVSELSLGYVRELTHWGAATVGLGGVGTVNLVPSVLQNIYGSRTPLGAMLFVRIRPARGSSMKGMAM